jgi:hypothetical protein
MLEFLVILYLATTLIAWYLFYGLECHFNSGSLGRHPKLFPYQCAWQELKWYLPGGKQCRIDFIKDKVSVSWQGKPVNGTICGSSHSWDYQEIREQELYLECAKDVLPGRTHLLMFFLAALFWPLTLLFIGIQRFR